MDVLVYTIFIKLTNQFDAILKKMIINNIYISNSKLKLFQNLELTTRF